MGEERRYAAGVEKQHGLVRRQISGANIGDERGHRLRRIHRIDQDAVAACQQANRLESFGRRDAIPLADVLLVRRELLGPAPDLGAEPPTGITYGRSPRRAIASTTSRTRSSSSGATAIRGSGPAAMRWTSAPNR